MDNIKILLFASNPEGTSQLKLDEEVRSIKEKIRSAEFRDILELISVWAVRPDDLLQELNTHKPVIVHFSGHGNKQGEIVLMDNSRQAKPVSAAALKMLFSTLKDNIRVVVLNACYSQIQAAAIAEIIDCVIGMSISIGDDASVTFAASFYRAIGFGRSVQEAFDQGKTALLLEGIPEDMTPQLLVRKGSDASRVVLTEITASKQLESLSPAIDLEVNKTSNFEFIDGLKKIIYTDAGEIEGTMVFGRGQKLLVSLVNRGPNPLIVNAVRVRLIAKELNFPPFLRYDKMEMTVPHTRLPIEAIESPIYLRESDVLQSAKEIGEGKIHLGAKGNPDAVHQIAFTTEAKDQGLWTYQLEAEYSDPTTDRALTVVCQERFMILLRGR